MMTFIYPETPKIHFQYHQSILDKLFY